MLDNFIQLIEEQAEYDMGGAVPVDTPVTPAPEEKADVVATVVGNFCDEMATAFDLWMSDGYYEMTAAMKRAKDKFRRAAKKLPNEPCRSKVLGIMKKSAISKTNLEVVRHTFAYICAHFPAANEKEEA